MKREEEEEEGRVLEWWNRCGSIVEHFAANKREKSTFSLSLSHTKTTIEKHKDEGGLG